MVGGVGGVRLVLVVLAVGGVWHVVVGGSVASGSRVGIRLR